MTTFVLILTISFGGVSAAMTNVPGFESDAACQAAGQVWMKEQPKLSSHNFVCVGQALVK